MSYWAGRYAGMDIEALEAGVNTMLQIAMKLLNKKPRRNDQLLLEDIDEDRQNG